MRFERIDTLDDPRVEAYRAVRDRDLQRREGLFIAEGRFIVRTLLGHRSLFRPRSLLLTPAAIDALQDLLEPLPHHVTVYLAEQDLMSNIVGFNIHRGCLAVAERGPATPPQDLLTEGTQEGRSLVVVLEELNNHDNLGAVFRNAAAFGATGVLLDPRCADPLYRKAIRVSMGGALVLPHARFDHWQRGLDTLRHEGFTLVALTPDETATEIAQVRHNLRGSGRIALMLGAEGSGLSPAAMDAADIRARIAMRSDLVDSLNVATTAAIALHHLSETTANERTE